LEILDDRNRARVISDSLISYTRSAPLTKSDAYQDAMRRIELAGRGRRDNGALAVYFGADDVFAADRHLQVGRSRYLITEVLECARCDGILPNGLDASLAMLVVAGRDRIEDVTLLRCRVEEYESNKMHVTT
jgi:hypothetical protein